MTTANNLANNDAGQDKIKVAVGVTGVMETLQSWHCIVLDRDGDK